MEPYLQARVQKFDSPRIRGQLIDGYRTAIDAALDRAEPELAAARAQHVKAEQAYQVAHTNATFMRNAFVNGRPASNLIDPSRFDPDA